MSAIKGSFQIDSENPVGRAQLIRTLEKHNELIKGTKAATKTHIGNHVKQYRKWRSGNPTWKPTDFEIYCRRATDYIMTRGIANAQSQTDTSVPRVAWKHRVHRNEYRENKLLNDPVYKNTAGYEVQWSQQEGVNARRYLDMHERATKTKSYVNTWVNPACLHYKAYRDRQRSAVCSPINVPMGPIHSPKKSIPAKGSSTKRLKRKAGSKASSRASTPSGNGKDGKPTISRHSQALLDQIASRVLQSAMASASNDRVRSMLVKAMENPELNPLRSQGSNPDAANVPKKDFKAMYKCDVITGFEAREELELSVQEGTTVFVLEDDKMGFFLCMDERGNTGRVPSACLHFTESVPLSSLPSAEYSLGRGKPVPGCNGVTAGDYGQTAGRVDYSRAMTAPVKKRSEGLNLTL